MSTLRIVGLGASAGGLAPLEAFFTQVSPQSGLAYVVVQHLNPTQKNMLVALLQKVTRMPVSEVTSNTAPQADHVYVLPPDAEVTLSKGRLLLEAPTEKRGLRLPIDALLTSMATDLGRNAVGVVLSGMGADGTLGIQAIRAAGGLTLAQDPNGAQFSAMPLSAINAGIIDIVCAPGDMPQRIAKPAEGQTKVAAPASDLKDVFACLLKKTGHDFSLYKPSTLHRRIQRRMRIHGTATVEAYAAMLRDNEQEVDLLFKELLIGVTSFFRDPKVWDHMRDHTVPDLLASQPADAHLRAWVVACSSGEEAYTLAMVFTEAIEQMPTHKACRLQIFATDLSADAITVARKGSYPAAIAEAVSPQRLARFFVKHGERWQVSKAIRDMVLFAPHDVLRDPPFTRLDLLCCRNLLIYFDTALQRKLLPLFHYTLRTGGVLMLGSAETAAPYPQLFEPLEASLRLYAAKLQAARKDAALLLKSFPPISDSGKDPAVRTPKIEANEGTLQACADRALLDTLAPPAVIVDAQGNIVYINGRTGKYLEPAAGKVNWNFHAMVKESLRSPIAQALQHAGPELPLQQLSRLVLDTQGKQAHLVDVSVHALLTPAALQGMTMIVFRDLAPTVRGRRKGHTVMDEQHALALQQCHEEIQHLRDQMSASNEELQSTNEELQSTNEELTTSKEEMQSMNEELHAANEQLQKRLDDLALAQNDMKHLLNSTDIAMLCLDKALNVSRYTDRATQLFKLRESDIGRPLSDLHSTLLYPNLKDDTQETLRTLNACEKQMPTSDGRWFAVKVMPYRRQDQVVDGAVITFVDITATKLLETQLRAASAS